VKKKEVSTGYEPRELQLRLHSSLKRFNVIVAHRRFGKTVCVINEMIDRALRCTLKNPQYAYLAPTYGQAKRVAWNYLKDFCADIPGAKPNEAELKIEIFRKNDKVTIMLLGTESPGSLRGIYLDGCVLDEFAESDPTVWTQVIRPALSDRKGWAIFIGTPKGQNHFYEVYTLANELKGNWFSCVYRASETGVVDEEELIEARKAMSEEEYMQEYECSFSGANTAAYFGKYILEAEKEDRITSVSYDKTLTVDTFWDLGKSDSTAIWFVQQLANQIRLIDYLETSGEEIEFYAKALKEKKYNYGEHYLPHDADAQILGMAKTRREQLISLGVRPIRIVAKAGVDDSIQAARALLNRCWFDAVKCKRGIDALRAYERKWDAKNKIYQSKPLHNWASHGSDAFRYLAVGIRPDRMDIRDNNRFPAHAEMEYNVFEY